MVVQLVDANDPNAQLLQRSQLLSRGLAKVPTGHDAPQRPLFRNVPDEHDVQLVAPAPLHEAHEPSQTTQRPLA